MLPHKRFAKPLGKLQGTAALMENVRMALLENGPHDGADTDEVECGS